MPPAMCEPKVGVDAEIETSSAACCRICLESSSGPGDQLISPCMCKGMQQFVHRSCLDHWRSVKEGTAFSHCNHMQGTVPSPSSISRGSKCRKMKFRLFVARDILLVFLAIQAIAYATSLVESRLPERNNCTYVSMCGGVLCTGWDFRIHIATAAHALPMTTIHAWLDPQAALWIQQKVALLFSSMLWRTFQGVTDHQDEPTACAAPEDAKAHVASTFASPTNASRC
ncbi:hypothetical protein EJB05_50323 [Eragrostis curvula]|uniref:RING-CH-type domain-containing protein n=1 Tax=Eragrostis curvula TaxID=38414 RepID=A0A5J9SZZ3_9POAL|nr:hypothetical protein EJB05_50323 [Eragrostis curvula]